MMPLIIGTTVLLEYMSLRVTLRSGFVSRWLLPGRRSRNRASRSAVDNSRCVLTGIDLELRWQKLA